MSASLDDSTRARRFESDDNFNYAVLCDCISSVLLHPRATNAPRHTKQSKRRRRAKGSKDDEPVTSNDLDQQDAHDTPEELSEFVEYIAASIFDAFPQSLKDLEYRSWRESDHLRAQFSLPLTAESVFALDLPPSIHETLVAYGLVAPDPDINQSLPATTEHFLIPIMTSYIETLTTPPPVSWASRTEACEICDRDWIPLSYHHLIPRSVHDKVVKRGWHQKEDLQNVAWLCEACHRFVHRFKSNEVLARDYYTVELLVAEEDVQKFAAWVGRLRWKGSKAR